jgi:hypothetical protein
VPESGQAKNKLLSSVYRYFRRRKAFGHRKRGVGQAKAYGCIKGINLDPIRTLFNLGKLLTIS